MDKCKTCGAIGPETPCAYPTSINLCDGKYTIIYDFATGQSECLRYGQPWRQLVGDKMVLACFDEIVRLRAELAAATNKLEMAEAIIADDGALITGLKNDLAAAQATIKQMREAIGAWERADGNEELQEAEAKLIAAMNAPANLDALHEALAKECERLACDGHLSIEGTEWLLEEAAAHRARKQATKEEGK